MYYQTAHRAIQTKPLTEDHADRLEQQDGGFETLQLLRLMKQAPLLSWIQRQWYEQSTPNAGLTLLEIPFRQGVLLRQMIYRKGWKTSERLPVPVIIVGNLTVGGSGKTPLTLWIAECLKAHGYRPGIISRGYGGKPLNRPLLLDLDTRPTEAGDEPVLMARRSGCPVCVFPQRAMAGRTLLTKSDCNVLIADDGLQHYGLARDIEIVVVDGVRGFGNGHCLPAGPLREPVGRLAQVDMVVHTGCGPVDSTVMALKSGTAVSLRDGSRRDLAEFRDTPVCALAGIGHPERFFSDLRNHGLTLNAVRAFPDHYTFGANDLAFAGTLPLLMTEKDAVKCRDFATASHWQVPVTAELPARFGEQLITLLESKIDG